MPACLQHGIRGSASSFKGSFRSLISVSILSCFLSTVYGAGPLSGKDAGYVEIYNSRNCLNVLEIDAENCYNHFRYHLMQQHSKRKGVVLMKQLVRILSVVLALTFLMLCLTSCTGHQMSQIQGFLNSFSEHTDLVEDGEYKPFNVPRMTMEKLMEYVEDENIDIIYEAFSPAVKEETDDLYEKIREFMRFYENTVTSWEYTSGSQPGKRINGVVLVTQTIFNDFFADNGTYRCDFSDVTRSTEQPKTVGISSIMLYPEELSPEYAPKKPSGIYIVYRVEDIPEDISIGLSSLETLMELSQAENTDGIYEMFSLTANRNAKGLQEKTSELLSFLCERVTAWEPYTWTRNVEKFDEDSATTQEMFFYLHTDDGLYRCDIREVLESTNQEDVGFSSISIFPALYPGEKPAYEDDVYKGYCTWGRENMGISIVYQQED